MPLLHLSVIFVTLAGLYASTALPTSGQVIDAETGNAISGVHVIAKWWGSINRVVDSSRDCFSVEVTQTDQHGQFRFSNVEAANILLSDKKQTLVFYKQGYMGAPNIATSAPVYRLTVDRRSGLERMRDISLIPNMACGSEEQQRTALLPVFKAVYAESQVLSKGSVTELKILDSELYRIEILEIGPAQAFKNLDKRSKEWRSK